MIKLFADTWLSQSHKRSQLKSSSHRSALPVSLSQIRPYALSLETLVLPPLG